MAQFIRSDLEFILEQIRIAEAHAAGTPLQQLIANPTLSFGLRTVDGSDNNLVQGQSEFGAADNGIPADDDAGIPRCGRWAHRTSRTAARSTTRAPHHQQPDRRPVDNNPAAVDADDADGESDDFIGNVTPDAGLSAPSIPGSPCSASSSTTASTW